MQRHCVRVAREWPWHIGLLASLLTVGTPAAARGQTCSLNGYPIDVSTSILRTQAQTTMTNCESTRIARVEGWISGMMSGQGNCQSGTYASGKCWKEETGRNAVVTVGVNACGFATAMSNSSTKNPNQVVNTNQESTIYAQCYDPAAECSAQGPDYYWNGADCVYTPGSPILISTSRSQRYDLTSAADGVLFDIDANGILDQVAWTSRNSRVAFLALDRNGDGRINNGSELFGNHTHPGARNGYQALSLLAAESNGGVFRGAVSGDDPLFAKLLLWTDTNHNGISEPNELRPAGELFSAFGVSYEPQQLEDEFGNKFAYRGWAHVRTAHGRNKAWTAEDDLRRTIKTWDVYFAIQ